MQKTLIADQGEIRGWLQIQLQVPDRLAEITQQERLGYDPGIS